LNRLERKGLTPVTIIIADLNGLKSANDQFGHAVGDALLRRAGEVLNALIEGPNHAAASAATSSRSCCRRPTPMRAPP
jgi:diguanylate cyclase (GGDEF)-like protein